MLAALSPLKLMSRIALSLFRRANDIWPATLAPVVGYAKLGTEFPHAFVDHAKGEYVVGAVHTHTIEGFWSIVMRGIVGTFHKVSSKYLPLYVNEFEFRYNNRKNQNIFQAAIQAC